MIKYEITENIANLGKRGGWSLQLNRVKWNDNPAKLDLRSWNEDYTKCSKGISLTEEEAAALKDALMQII